MMNTSSITWHQLVTNLSCKELMELTLTFALIIAIWGLILFVIDAITNRWPHSIIANCIHYFVLSALIIIPLFFTTIMENVFVGVAGIVTAIIIIVILLFLAVKFGN